MQYFESSSVIFLHRSFEFLHRLRSFVFSLITHKEQEVTSHILSYESNVFSDVASRQQLKEEKNKKVMFE